MARSKGRVPTPTMERINLLFNPLRRGFWGSDSVAGWDIYFISRKYGKVKTIPATMIRFFLSLHK